MTKFDTSALAFGVTPQFRDKAYIKAVRDMPCFISGFYSSDYDAVDPAHIGVGGRGLKAADFYALPLLHSLHSASHGGDHSFWVEQFKQNRVVMLEALQGRALVEYLKWVTGTTTDYQLAKWVKEKMNA